MPRHPYHRLVSETFRLIMFATNTNTNAINDLNSPTAAP